MGLIIRVHHWAQKGEVVLKLQLIRLERKLRKGNDVDSPEKWMLW